MNAVDWIDQRVGVVRPGRKALDKAFPTHWSFMLGEIALYSFLILVATGVYLSFFFDASLAETVYEGDYAPLHGLEVTQAYASTVEISFDVRAGLLVRQMHHWATLVFLGAILAHLLRIFFTGAFRRPREANWMIGVTLLALALFNGFSGYSLPDDLLSGTGLRIAYSAALSVPLVGEEMTSLFFGGEFPGEDVIGRLFVLHVLVVPLLLFGLIGAHMFLLVRQRHTQFGGRGRREDNVVGEPVWPSYALKSLGLFFVLAGVLAALGGLVQINPIWLYGPYEPANVTSPAQPDWYLMWVEGALRVFPAWRIEVLGVVVPEQFIPAVLLPGLAFTALLLWPFIEARASGDRDRHELLDRPRDHPVRTGLGVAGVTFASLLLLAAANDLIARLIGVGVLDVTRAFQVALLVLPPLTGFAAYRIARALKRTGAAGPLSLPLRGERGSG